MSNMYKRIEALCKYKNINVTALCKELGISRSSLSELNAGRTKTLSSDYVAKIAGFFNVSTDYLIHGKTHDESLSPLHSLEGLNPVEDMAYFKIMSSAKKDGLSPGDIEVALDFIRRARLQDATTKGEKGQK